MEEESGLREDTDLEVHALEQIALQPSSLQWRRLVTVRQGEAEGKGNDESEQKDFFCPH